MIGHLSYAKARLWIVRLGHSLPIGLSPATANGGPRQWRRSGTRLHCRQGGAGLVWKRPGIHSATFLKVRHENDLDG